ncbi:MAG: hypothetical protein MUF51_07865 [Vicinamibacteria bacterium]|nr:hypothetical protein [Vicinamibacteria bacterium]
MRPSRFRRSRPPASTACRARSRGTRAILYDELLADVIVKAISMKARWQIERLQSARPVVLMAIDEPALAGFEKDQIRLSREQIIMMLDEVVAAIHQENAWAAVHCCAATDWSLILSSQANCLSLDAYGYMDSLAAYPAELRAFLDRGGAIIWGIVPTDERLEQVTPADLAERLWQGFSRLALKARIYDVTIGMDELAEHSLLSPACGLGTLSIAQADRALDCLVETAARLRARR